MHDRMDHEVARIPFDSIMKRSIVAIRPKDMADTVRVYVKGAPEYIIPNCTTHYSSAGQKVPLADSTTDYLSNSIIREKMT
jgi:magnesium-transporting ATPase (P-type)